VTGGVSIGEDWDYRQNARVLRGWIASNRVEVRLTDAAQIGRVATDAVDVAGAKVEGPRWIVEPTNEALTAARRAAAADARARAEAYASALGLRLGAVEAIVEPGSEPVARARAVSQAASDIMTMAAATPQLPVNEGDLDVRAAVTVVFTLLA
jgi:uncharacterized protein YggE